MCSTKKTIILLWAEHVAGCISGTMQSPSICVLEEDQTKVDDAFCLELGEEKPEDLQQNCNSHPCPAKWV